ncbi:MAG: SoxR reducing system RseC family protein [Deltaproteobacteria bacterium]|nr:SoxR reducing system RseC family protein [Deltaproteobacteria bacterium]MBW2171109.1 SoxR reducing system RseC family protein [Deltaproteobacteria bacterium]MBW2259036.1 SoxR reducing system RseC family protein [Deltaproteobacteria bacterium]
MGEVLTRTGVVRAIQGRMALVVTIMEPECESCKAKEACSTLGGGGANAEIPARNTAGAEVGDIVTISMAGSSLVKVSFLVYMLPILVLIAGIVLGHLLSTVIPVNENILVGVFGLFGFSGTFVWLKKKGDSLSNKPGFVPEITSKQTPTQQFPPTDLACPVK